ncbi:Probable LRR receptor-like serine/threonine-protein kinase At3g47570 [Linum grandiflorum]
MITSDSLGALSSWNDSIHFCEWHGVSCSARHYGRVTALRLRSQGLSGSISTHVGNLSFLKVLDLIGNSLVGEIPSEIGCLHRLQKLLLSNNSLDGEIPSNISRCSALIIFYLDNNQLSGRVPATLGQLKSIQLLSFGGNNLSGEIPSSIFNLSSFTEMWLGRNQFHGILPWNLGLLLPNLEVFDVEINQFTGSIPFSLSNASKLVRLQLGDNNFTGSMPSMEVSNQLIGFSIPGNSLGSGKDNDLNFLTSLTNATNLVDIIISENNFGGSLPKDIGNLSTNLRLLSFSNNKIYGNIPSGIQYFVNLEVLAASNNNLSGSFGTVYKGVLDDISEITINIAVKVFNLQRRGASKSFIAECEALKNIRHRNLVKIVTVCSSVDHEGNDFKALIYEFLANGSLEDWLYQPVERIDESTTRSLNFIQRLKIAIDIASAVDYLHNNCGTPIVHCDLKPSNVLLGEDIVAHVGDFGLARFLSTVDNPSSNTIGIKGTVGYAPPEYGMGNDVSIQGDVYSYGILLLELYTGKRPTNEIFRDGLSLHNVVMGAVLEKRTLEVVDPILLNELLPRKEQEELMSSILQIGIACSSDIPEERISMNEVLFRFTAVEKKICPVEKR